MFVDYVKEGKIATITLNRPDAYNALNPQMFKELSEVLVDFTKDDNINRKNIEWLNDTGRY